jgi:sugar-specific transcriptional regulator TrmB
VLNSLLEKNLIRTFKQGLHTYFVIDDINKLALHEKQRLTLAQNLIKTLKENQDLNPGIQVHHYKGPEGYREIYEDILKIKPKELLGWMNLDHFYQAIDAEREIAWTKERIASGIHVRLILQESELTKNFQKDDKDSNRETRFIPKGHPFETSCLLFDNTITFFDSRSDITAIRIYNPQLFQMQKQIFEMNWGALPTNG